MANGDTWQDDLDKIGEGVLAGDIEEKEETTETNVDITEVYDFDCEENDNED